MSRNLADFVWLEEITFAIDLVTIRGKAQTPIAVANFFRNLEESKNFADVAMVNQERISYWTGTGAQLSDTVARLVKKQAATLAEQGLVAA